MNVQSATNTVSTLVHSKPNSYLQDVRLEVLDKANKEWLSDRMIIDHQYHLENKH